VLLGDAKHFAAEATTLGELIPNMAITPFRIIDFGTNQKLVFDFLLVNNTNIVCFTVSKL